MGGTRTKHEVRGRTNQPDWRHAIWNRWLISYLTPKEDLTSAPESAPAEGQATSEDAADPTVTPPNVPHTEPAATADPGPDSEPPEKTDPKRTSLSARVRLDALSEQLLSVEAALDSLTQRLNVSAAHERISARRVTDGIDRLTELADRHTEVLVSCVRALERLERRWMDTERRERLSLPPEPRATETASRRPPVSGSRVAPDLGHPFSGNLADLSVPTLLSMFELEQRTGRLTLSTTSGALTLELEEGKLGQTFFDGVPSEPVDALARVIDARSGRFLFTPGELVTDDLGITPGPKMSVGSVLLRIGQRNDEANRDAFGT